MQIAEEGSTTMAKKQRNLAMEDYLDFLDNRTVDLTATQLREIIGMHGFKKKGFQKSLLIHMVSTMDLMNLCRSTLLDGGVSGDACLSLEEVIKDLKDLNWQECHVISLLTEGADLSASAASGATVSVKRRKPKGLGKKPIEVGVHSAVSAGTTVAAGSTTEGLRSAESDSMAVVSCPASPPIISILTDCQIRRLTKSRKF